VPLNATDPADVFRKFKGRDAKIEALMEDFRFPTPQNYTCLRRLKIYYLSAHIIDI
jgi:hypothetical protein